jgi:tetratricopeptide (TPR) repeat protein
VLRGGAHDLPPHQQTLRGTIDWSFALLERGTQQRLAQLGVFAGGCTIEALEALSDGSSAATAGLLDDLTTLVDHHLVQRVAGASGSRFTLLETIREYALEQLAGSPGAAETQARHAAYFRDLALRASPHLQSPEQIVWLQRLDDEHENMRAALAWFIEQRRPEDAIAICGAIDVYWLLRGMAAESRRWLSAALAQATAPTPERASGLLSLGLAHAANGEPAAALTAFDAALALFERHEDEEGIAAVLNHSGAALLAVGERTAGLERLEQSRAIYQAQGFVLGIGCVQSKISVALMRGDELDRGLRMADEALELLAQAGDRLDTAGLNSGIGSALLADGQTERAIEHLQRSLQLYRELQAPDAIAALLCTLGRAELERAQPQRATELLLDALCQAQRIHNLDIPPLALVRLADAAAQTERYADAAQLLGAAAGALDDPAPGSRTPVHQEYMAVRERTQAVLPPAAWESAWGSGRSAGLTQTVRGLIGRG